MISQRVGPRGGARFPVHEISHFFAKNYFTKRSQNNAEFRLLFFIKQIDVNFEKKREKRFSPNQIRKKRFFRQKNIFIISLFDRVTPYGGGEGDHCTQNAVQAKFGQKRE